MNQILGFVVGLLQSALSLLGFVQTHPDLPQAQHDQAVQVAQQAITTATNVIANNSTVTQTQATVSVPGMQKYTDADFGFSFWYPSTWTVKSVGTWEGSWGDGTTVKRIVVGPEGQAITLFEVSSATRSITIGNPAKSGMEETYYFDSTLHTWMYKHDGASGSSEKLITEPANVSSNTMGGLHMFTGRGTFGLNIAVPLSARTFVIAGYADYLI